MEPERTLTRRELNRALLARQLLLERAETTVAGALERLGGLQAQYAPSMYVGLWSRLAGFPRESLTRLLERRTVVQATLMRVTIHLVARRDFWPFALATRDARRRLWLTSQRDRLDEGDMAEAVELLRPRLADGPLKRTEIEQLVGKARASGVGLWIDLVRAPPSGTWQRRRADLYALAESWIGAPEVSVDDGVEHLVRRYLTAFGPATRPDIALYTGLSQRAIAPALERLRLRRFRGEGGEELLDLPRGPLPAPDTPAPVRFLPTWDATLLVHARRTGILPEEHRPRIFTSRNPHSMATFLVDGAVAGTWRYEKGRIALEPFGRLDRGTERELREEAERLAQFHA
ncbi:MAG: winged helix DNA-binding domain-containing protein [Thermoleophilaceae bacterium]